MVEQKVVTGGSRKSTVADTVPGASRKPQKLNEIDSRSEARLSLNNEEIDRILGGGIVEGVLLHPLDDDLLGLVDELRQRIGHDP